MAQIDDLLATLALCRRYITAEAPDRAADLDVIEALLRRDGGEATAAEAVLAPGGLPQEGHRKQWRAEDGGMTAVQVPRPVADWRATAWAWGFAPNPGIVFGGGMWNVEVYERMMPASIPAAAPYDYVVVHQIGVTDVEVFVTDYPALLGYLAKVVPLGQAAWELHVFRQRQGAGD